MDTKTVSNKAYMGVIKELRRLFAESYHDGGWLPPGREMAEKLGVSHKTYCKALACVVHESFVQSHPRKGHYVVPERFRCHKVGLILKAGTESPFLGGAEELRDAIAVLRGRGLFTQIVQGSSVAQLFDNAVILGVDGLLWFDPPPREAERIAAAATDSDMPLVLLQSYLPDSFDLPGVCCVNQDLEQRAKLQAEALFSRGHRTLAYVGDYQYAQRCGLVAILEAAGNGLPPERCVEMNWDEPGQVATMVKVQGVTGIIVEGMEHTQLRLFEELATLPVPERPEVLLTYQGLLDQLCAQFPGTSAVRLETRDGGKLGAQAAKILADHLLEGAPLLSLKLKYNTPTAPTEVRK